MQVSAMFLLLFHRFSTLDEFEWNENEKKKGEQSNIENMHFLGIFAEHKIQESVCLWNINPMMLISHVDGIDTTRSSLIYRSLSLSPSLFLDPVFFLSWATDLTLLNSLQAHTANLQRLFT